ncbi:hypothetical protein ACX0HA_09565 [Flavobacterium hauense]
MNEKHNLDRLFQEKFKDFEVAPPEFVWENIREELQEKKKRRVIPLWFRLSGVAALLVLGGFITTLFINDAENPAVNAPAVVIENTTATPTDALKASPATTPDQTGPSATGTSTETNNINNTNTAVASGDNNTNATGSTTAQPNSINKNTVPSFGSGNTAVAHEGHNTIINRKNGKKVKRNAAIRQGDAVASSETINQSNKNNSALNPANAPQNQKAALANEGLAAVDTKSSIKNTDSTNRANQSNIIQRQNAINNAIAAEGVAGTDNSKAADPANAETGTAVKSNTIIDKNIPPTEAVAQTQIDTAATIVPENELEKLLQEKLKGKEEDKAVAENKKSKERWNIKPQVAPVFYSSLSDGSPINEQFASNSKSYDNDLSYGLGINYAVSDRISIRSGINTVNLNYSTNDIAYYASLNGLTSNIGESKAANIVIQNPGDVSPEPFLIDGQSTQLMEGSMVQKTGYIEIPLEMSYALVNKKFGIDLIGGVSGLFLNENNVSVVSSTGMSTEVGQAQNLNNLHFSTNVGVGFKYKFWESFQANFEPTFKYQVNAYSRDAGNFKPYFIGLYSGVSFSF